MKISKLLVISGILLLSNYLSAMEYINKEVNHNIQQLFNTTEYGDIWNGKEIQDATKNLEFKLAHKDFKDILFEFNNKVLSSIANSNCKKCLETELSKKATEKYLKNIIKQKIVAPKNSLEENMKNLVVNINEKNKDVLFNIIIEDYIDKYINSNPIDLQKIFNSKLPSGEILYIATQYKDQIYEKFRISLASLEDYGYFIYLRYPNLFIKKYNNKKQYESLICSYILNKLAQEFGKYFVSSVENNGWDAVLNKYKMEMRPYIKKRLLPQVFDDYIISNNISVYTLSNNDFLHKYNDAELQNRWEEFVDGKIISIFNQYINEDNSIDEMSEQFIDPLMKEYAFNRYKELLEYRVKREIEYNTPLNIILDKYKNENTKSLINTIYNELNQNSQKAK